MRREPSATNIISFFCAAAETVKFLEKIRKQEEALRNSKVVPIDPRILAQWEARTNERMLADFQEAVNRDDFPVADSMAELFEDGAALAESLGETYNPGFQITRHP